MENKSAVHEYKTIAEKRSDFISGFFVWFVVSSLFMFSCFGILLALLTIGRENTGSENSTFTIPLFINGIILLWLFSTRIWRAWGMLSAIIVNALITIVVNYLSVPGRSTSMASFISGNDIEFLGFLGMMNIPYWLYFVF